MAKKAKEYVFKFGGSKEAFLNRLRQLTNDHDRDRRFFYFDNYIVDVKDDEISFGVGRAGHSGGYWFVSHFAEENAQMEFRGTVQYIGPEDDRTKGRKAFDNVLFVLFCILAFPVLLVLWISTGISLIINKLRKKPKPLTTEENLFDLMENHLGCQRV